MNSCDNCKYEPEWGPVRGNDEYRRAVGECKKVIDIPILPACFHYPHNSSIIRYEEDGSGVHHNCKTWEPKGE